MNIGVDIDGTLANCDHRMGYIESKPKNWKAFFAAAKNDLPYPLVKLVKQLCAERNMIFLITGRPEYLREDTEDWMYDQGVPYHALFMRPPNNFDPDYVVKRQLYHEQIIPEYGPLDLMFDDRSAVVSMWRDLGIYTLDCNQQLRPE